MPTKGVIVPGGSNPTTPGTIVTAIDVIVPSRAGSNAINTALELPEYSGYVIGSVGPVVENEVSWVEPPNPKEFPTDKVFGSLKKTNGTKAFELNGMMAPAAVAPGPVAPVAPGSPVGPCGPVDPCSPAPVGPVGPANPTGPCGPVIPRPV